jgi:uncharacterized membrane-anchored protein YhcB (DUF1043 family)
MTYMRIESNKFWGWVVVSLLVGLGIGLAIMFMQGAGRASEINKLKSQLTSRSQDASGTLSDLQARLAGAEASVTELTARNSQLTSDLASTQAALAAAKKTTSSTSSTGTLVITSRAVSPSRVATGASLTLTVKVKGHADRVRMEIIGTGYDKLYYLTKVSTSGGVETWSHKVTAPSKKGTYRYYAGAFIGTKRFTMSGVSPTFQVK